MFVETPRTWIVVADGGRAKIMEYNGPDSDLQVVPGSEMEQSNRQNRDIVSDDRGRAFPGKGISDARSAFEWPTDPHQYEEWKFIHEVANFLDEHINDFDRLVVAAAPRALGDLRKEISSHVQEKVYAELNKDLTKIPSQELRQHLQGVVNLNVQ